MRHLEFQLGEQDRKHALEKAKWKEDMDKVKLATDRMRFLEAYRKTAEEQINRMQKVIDTGNFVGKMQVFGNVIKKMDEIDDKIKFEVMVVEGHKKMIDGLEQELAKYDEIRTEIRRSLNEIGLVVGKTDLKEISRVRELMV